MARKAVRRRRFWIILVVLAITVLLSWSLISSALELRSLKAERAAAQRNLQQVEEQNASLEKEIEESGSDDFVIRMARKLLGWVFPNEYRVIESPDS